MTGGKALTNPELLKRLKRNRARREKAGREATAAREELLALLRVAEHAPDGPQMVTIAEITGLDRRTLYDLRKNDRRLRAGAGSERS